MGILGDVNVKPEQFKEIAADLDPFIKDWLARAAQITAPLSGGIKVTIEVKITGLYNTAQTANQLPDAPQPKTGE